MQKDSISPTQRRLVVLGHRGACGYEPENTLASFAKALELGVDIIEFDVHQCASGELVVIHDSTVNRTTNGTGYVNKLTLEQLKQLDAGKSQHIPTLQEVLDFIDRKAIVNIELKGTATAEPTAHVIDLYVSYKGWYYTDFLVSSFDHKQLHIIHRFLPQVPLMTLMSYLLRTYARIAQELNAWAVAINYQRVTPAFIADAHKHNLAVIVYTVNAREDIAHMTALGVDGICSDYPDLVKKV